MIILRTDSFISPEHRARILREVKEYGVAILDGADWSVSEVENEPALRRQLAAIQDELDYAISERDFTSKWFSEAAEELESVRKERDELKNKLTTTGLTNKDLDLATKLKYGNVAAHNLSFSYDINYGTGVNMSFRFREGSHEHENYLWKSLKERMV